MQSKIESIKNLDSIEYNKSDSIIEYKNGNNYKDNLK